jgi:hypothetical protein
MSMENKSIHESNESPERKRARDKARGIVSTESTKTILTDDPIDSAAPDVPEETEVSEVSGQVKSEIILPLKPYAVRLETILNDSQTIEKIFSHVSNGGDLITFCDIIDVRYSDIASWITEDASRYKKFSAACVMGQEWVKRRILNELGSIGLLDIRGLLNNSGSLRDPGEWPEDVARAIAGIEVDDIYDGKGINRRWVGQAKKVKLTDKLRALELIGKELGMFVDRKKLEVSTKLEDLVGGSFGEISEITAAEVTNGPEVQNGMKGLKT